jgi:redox-sensing transcriptional repressor
VLTNQKTIARLSRYRNTLLQFKSYGLSWIYSDQIASSLGITAAQVRKDFSLFGVTGKRKMGYHIEIILENLNKILGKNERQKAIIAGFGPLGKAFYSDYLVNEKGVEITTAFDDPSKFLNGKDTETGLTILPFSEITTYITAQSVQFGIIAIPDKTAQRVLDMMVLAGIKGILSLSSIELKSPSSCFVNSINLLREFENVLFFGGKQAKRSAQRARS